MNSSEDDFDSSLSINSSKQKEEVVSLSLILVFIVGAVVGAFLMQCYLLNSSVPSNLSSTKLRRPEL